MRLRDFHLLDIYLTVTGKSFDLHNNYDFTGFTYQTDKRSLLLTWKRGKGAWVPATDPLEIHVELKEVSHFSASPRAKDSPYSDDECLDCVSFVEPHKEVSESFDLAPESRSS